MPPSSEPAPVTRLAPSPTGALHLGNARTFLINWALARSAAWRIVLRIEDLDTPRNKPDADRQVIETLRWLGIDWDEGPTLQSSDLSRYQEAMRSLAARALVYPSELTRTQIEAAASAPQDSTGEIRFPADLRPPVFPRDFDQPTTNWRMVVPDVQVEFDDDFAGPQRLRPAQSIGDMVLWTRRAQPAYQLAVVVDDHYQRVNRIVRGDDLLDSAARQLLVYRALDCRPEPRYCHLPLVVGEDGRRLAKRHGDTRVDIYRSRRVRPERVIGLVAGWSGLERRETAASEFAERFRLDTMPRTPVVFRPEDDEWLLSG